MATYLDLMRADLEKKRAEVKAIEQALAVLDGRAPKGGSRPALKAKPKGEKVPVRQQILAMLPKNVGDKAVPTSAIREVTGAGSQYIGQTVHRLGGYRSTPNGWVRDPKVKAKGKKKKA